MTANSFKIARNDHSKLLDSVTKMRNCEDVVMNGLVANNIFGGAESQALFVSPLHNIGDFGTSGSQYKALHLTKSSATNSSATNSTSNPKWSDIRSECVTTMDSMIHKYSKKKFQLQTYLFLSSQENNQINFELSRSNYDKYFTLNCPSEKAKSLNDPSCAWSDDSNFSDQILVANFV